MREETRSGSGSKVLRQEEHEAVSDTESLKQSAEYWGADLVGVAPMARFEGAPAEMDPRFIFPEAKACVVVAIRIPRGVYRGIEEGTYFAAAGVMGYGAINLNFGPFVLWRLVRLLEDAGYEAVPITNVEDRLVWIGGKQVAPDRPAPDIKVNLRLAAVAAGLGEIGYSKLLLTPRFGPRQRIAGLVLTDAPLEPDPLFEGQICDRCLLCVRDCSAQAISRDETDSVTVGGRTFEWGRLDTSRCTLGYAGGVRETSPYLTEEAEANLSGEQPWASIMGLPYNRAAYDGLLHHPVPIEGARGCIRACMIHLEETGRIQARFHEPFRKRPMWRL